MHRGWRPALLCTQQRKAANKTAFRETKKKKKTVFSIEERHSGNTERRNIACEIEHRSVMATYMR